jgi:hypothetical protein
MKFQIKLSRKWICSIKENKCRGIHVQLDHRQLGLPSIYSQRNRLAACRIGKRAYRAQRPIGGVFEIQNAELKQRRRQRLTSPSLINQPQSLTHCFSLFPHSSKLYLHITASRALHLPSCSSPDHPLCAFPKRSLAPAAPSFTRGQSHFPESRIHLRATIQSQHIHRDNS